MVQTLCMKGFVQLIIFCLLQVLAIFQEVGVNNTLYFLVFGESLLNGKNYILVSQYGVNLLFDS